jgi:hypothetical protein
LANRAKLSVRELEAEDVSGCQTTLELALNRPVLAGSLFLTAYLSYVELIAFLSTSLLF